MLYNIRYAAGIGKQFHWPVPYSGYFKSTHRKLQEIGNYIQTIHPDVVGLVEVDNGSFRAGRQCQAGAIAHQLDHDHVFKNKYRVGSVISKMPLTVNQGNAFLTNREIRNTRFHYLNNGVKRLVIELELADVTMFLVHLSVKSWSRQKQLKDLSAIVNTSSKPAIVAGDFNVFGGVRELKDFMAATGLSNANGAGLASHPSRAPKRHLDHILHSPQIRVDSFYAPLVTFSDHLPLVCDFTVEPRNLLK
ncbi:MAG: endonuclease/exonuclease/phosphatase family protein [Pseudomonadota bacterium]